MFTTLPAVLLLKLSKSDSTYRELNKKLLRRDLVPPKNLPSSSSELRFPQALGVSMSVITLKSDPISEPEHSYNVTLVVDFDL